MAPETGSSGTVAAVVPAAGSGERLAAGIPKAFCEIDGASMLARAVAGLLDSKVVDHVVVAVPADRVDEAKRLLPGQATVVAGGADRTASVRRQPRVRAGPRRRPRPDAAGADRPGAARRSPRRGAGAAAADTVKAVDANGVVLGTPERDGLRAVQTPQGFAADLLLRAYAAGAGTAGFTDDASLVEHVGGQVQVVDGDPLAFKITTQLDLLLAETIVRR